MDGPAASESAAGELVVTGEIVHWRGPAPFHFVAAAPDVAAALHELAAEVSYGWGMVPVRVRLGGTVWTTSLWPKDGGYLLPLRDAVRRAERVGLGDEVTAHLQVASRGPRR